MDPMRAAIVSHAESAGIGDAAAANVSGCFEQHELSSGRADPARRRNAGSSRANDHYVEIGGSRCGCGNRGCCKRCGRGSKK